MKLIFITMLFLFSISSVLALKTEDFFPTLISNTEQCLVNCEAIFEFNNPTLSSVNIDNDFSKWYEKEEFANNLNSFKIEKQINTSYQVSVPVYGDCYLELNRNESFQCK